VFGRIFHKKKMCVQKYRILLSNDKHICAQAENGRRGRLIIQADSDVHNGESMSMHFALGDNNGSCGIYDFCKRV
jgi:hypothetical protein